MPPIAEIIALNMLTYGIARIERSGNLIEFCFDGMRYPVSNQGRMPDWDTTIRVIGVAKCLKAVEAAR